MYHLSDSTKNVTTQVDRKCRKSAHLICDIAKIAKFAKLNRMRNLVDLQ